MHVPAIDTDPCTMAPYEFVISELELWEKIFYNFNKQYQICWASCCVFACHLWHSVHDESFIDQGIRYFPPHTRSTQYSETIASHTWRKARKCRGRHGNRMQDCGTSGTLCDSQLHGSFQRFYPLFALHGPEISVSVPQTCCITHRRMT